MLETPSLQLLRVQQNLQASVYAEGLEQTHTDSMIVTPISGIPYGTCLFVLLDPLWDLLICSVGVLDPSGSSILPHPFQGVS